tara:strand:+ start:79 stop:540 length:462 start_codon:yes stop_codon:yes gene_type:complete
MSWTLAFTAISALTTVGSTIMSIQQARANQKQIKANAAWRAYQNNLELEIEKQRKLREQTKLMSEQRARQGASGAQMYTGSLLTATMSDLEDFEDDMVMLGRLAYARTSSIDVEARGLINNETSKIYGAIGEGIGNLASAGMQYKQMKALGMG